MKKKLTRLFKAANNKVSNAIGKFLMWAMGEQIKDGIYQMRHKIVDHYTLKCLLREDETFGDYLARSEDFARKVVSWLDPSELRKYIDYEDLAHYLDDRELAGYIDEGAVASYIDLDELASNIDINDYISDSLDYEQVADHIDTDEVARNIDFETLSDYIDEGAIADALSGHYLDEVVSRLDIDSLADKIDLHELGRQVDYHLRESKTLIDGIKLEVESYLMSVLDQEVKGFLENATFTVTSGH